MSDTSESDTEQWCRDAIDRNKSDWEDFKNGEERALNYLVGQVMEISGGKADPRDVTETFHDLHTEIHGGDSDE